MKTIQNQLALVQNRPSGFDYLRLTLAIAIIVWHSNLVSHGYSAEGAFWSSAWRPLPFFLVPSFFALSGFLVASSLERNELFVFVLHRVVRIYPALVLEVVLSALILGPLITELPLASYFSDPLFWKYWLNVPGFIQYELPGVFTTNPLPNTVNLQLWTIPFELKCYALITGLSLFRIHRAPRMMAALLVFAMIFMATSYLWRGFEPVTSRPPGSIVVLAFLFGANIYFLRELIPFNRYAFGVSAVLFWGLSSYSETQMLSTLPVAYVTVYLGLLNPRHTQFSRMADYSYGIYLYGFPVQQAVAYLFPGTREWYLNSAFSILPAIALGALSWHLVEVKILEKRRSITQACLEVRDRARLLVRKTS